MSFAGRGLWGRIGGGDGGGGAGEGFGGCGRCGRDGEEGCRLLIPAAAHLMKIFSELVSFFGVCASGVLQKERCIFTSFLEPRSVEKRFWS